MKKLLSFLFIIFLIKSNLVFGESKWITKKKLDIKIEGECTTSMTIEELNLEADKFYDDNIYNKSFKCGLIAANKGDAYAQGNVGWHYQTGNGITLDNKKAVKWFKLGADQNSPYSLTQLAHHYIEGLGVSKDEKKAFGLNIRAANLGYAYGQAEVGWHYLNGMGVKHNNKLAIKWFKLAAEQNNAFAQSNLGWMIANGQGIKQDYKKGFEWTKKAVDRDNDYAQANLGWHYENGYGVEKNIDEAIKWFELAAKQDNEFAKEHLLNLTKSKTTTADSSFITKKDSKTISDSKESTEISSWITKKEKEEVRKDEAKEKVLVAEKKENSNIGDYDGKLNWTETPILEEWVVITKTWLLEKPDIDSNFVDIKSPLKKNEKIIVWKKIEGTNIVGIWFKIETKSGQIGFSLENKFQPSDFLIAGSFQTGLLPGGELITYDIDWGDYYALVIGNNNYTNFSPLETPINDAKKIGEILEKKYNFTVNVLPDATKDDILENLYAYRNILTKEDNLLIYYAGHGTISTLTKEGIWQPIGANDNDWSGIMNSEIVRIIENLNAKHIIVIADSCFSGSILNEWELKVVKGEIDNMPESKNNLLDFFIMKNIKKSRVALTSGNLEPVPDKINEFDLHSAFANTLINILSNNYEPMLSNELFVKLQKKLYIHETIQEPLYGGINTKSHSYGGEFIFVPIN